MEFKVSGFFFIQMELKWLRYVVRRNCTIEKKICDALQEKVIYVGKRNLAVELKIACNLKKVEFQVLMDMCSKYV